jgi:hypothetical protein
MDMLYPLLVPPANLLDVALRPTSNGGRGLLGILFLKKFEVTQQ